MMLSQVDLGPVLLYRGGVGTFEVKAHAAEALRKVDELFNNDKVPAFNSPSSKDDKAPKFGGKGKPGMSLPAQKALAWAAVHLLLYLEGQCQWMADYVSALRPPSAIITSSDLKQPLARTRKTKITKQNKIGK